MIVSRLQIRPDVIRLLVYIFNNRGDGRIDQTFTYFDRARQHFISQRHLSAAVSVFQFFFKFKK
jgi:hypothetical protein